MRRCFFILCLLCGSAWATPAETFEARIAKVEANCQALGAPERYAELAAKLNQDEAELGPPAKRVRLPAQSHPNGKVKALILAKVGWFTLDMKHVVGRDLRVEYYSETGKLEGFLEADKAVIDRTAMLAVVKGRLFMSMSGDTIEGKNAYCDLEQDYVHILEDGVIHTSRMSGVNLTERGLF